MFGATLFSSRDHPTFSKMLEELLVITHVVHSASCEAFVQDTDELVRGPRVHGTAPQPSRGERHDTPVLLAQVSASIVGSSASQWTAASLQPFKWRHRSISCVDWNSRNSMDSSELLFCLFCLLKKCSTKRLTAPHHHHLPTNSKPFLQAELVRSS